METEHLQIPLLILIAGGALLATARRLTTTHAAVAACAVLVGAGTAWILAAGFSVGIAVIGTALLCGTLFVVPKMMERGGVGETPAPAFSQMCGLVAACLVLGTAHDIPTLYGALLLMTVCLQVWMRRRAAPEACDACLRYQAGCLLLVTTALVWIYGATGEWSVVEIAARGLGQTPELHLADNGGVLVATVLMAAGLCGAAVMPVIPIGRRTLLRDGDISATAIVCLLPAVSVGLALRNWLPEIATFDDAPITVLLLVQWLLVGGAGWLMFGRTRISSLLGGLIVLRMSFWLLGIAVECWHMGHPDRGWTSSGLPVGGTAATMCIMADVLALLALISAIAGLGTDREPEYLDDLAGLLRLHPLRGAVAALALLSLIGIPPLPGFWAHWSLLTTVFGPQQFSTMTRLYAPHLGFVAGAAVAAGGFVILTRVCLAALQRIAMDAPRGRCSERVGGLYVALPAALLGLLLLTSVRPAWMAATPADPDAGQVSVPEDETPEPRREVGAADMRR